MGKGKYLFLSWDAIHTYAVKLAEEISRSGDKFDYVLGVLRGGAAIAAILSDLLNIDLISIRTKSYVGSHKRSRPIIYSEPCVQLAGSKVLVVDDVCDTGDTIKTIEKYLQLKGVSSYEFAVIVKKSTCNHELKYWVLEDDRWIIFPWEIREVFTQDPEGVAEAVREGMSDETSSAILGFIGGTGKG